VFEIRGGSATNPVMVDSEKTPVFPNSIEDWLGKIKITIGRFGRDADPLKRYELKIINS